MIVGNYLFLLKVMINCENQINRYDQPCGSILTKVAKDTKILIQKNPDLGNCLFICLTLRGDYFKCITKNREF